MEAMLENLKGRNHWGRKELRWEFINNTDLRETLLWM